jgi:HK97 family phage major capsid protein
MQVPAPILDRKTTITSSTVGSSTPGILVPSRVPGIVKPPVRPLRVRDLIPFGTTQNNAVEFVKENVFTNAASPQTEGGDKAESALTFTIDYANVRTIAHWIPATSQVLADFAQLQGYIDTRLLDGLADEEDDQLLMGDGVGLSIHGLTHEATAYAGTYDAGSDTRLDKLNHALAELEAGNYQADGWVLNPVDLRIIQVIKENIGGANLGAYVFGGPNSSLPVTIWGLPVAVTTAMTVGKFLVGNFRNYCMGFDRMMSRIDVSTEHEDYFIKNMVAIRAEERIALAIFKGAAFRYGSF